MEVAVPRTLPLLHGAVTLSQALGDEDNMLFRLEYRQKRFDFYVRVHTHREEFQAIIARHLGLRSRDSCELSEVKQWKHGSFNLCIPGSTSDGGAYAGKRVLLRLPLPYKIAETLFPRNADEKIRTEAATYIWM